MITWLNSKKFVQPIVNVLIAISVNIFLAGCFYMVVGSIFFAVTALYKPWVVYFNLVGTVASWITIAIFFILCAISIARRVLKHQSQVPLIPNGVNFHTFRDPYKLLQGLIDEQTIASLILTSDEAGLKYEIRMKFSKDDKKQD